MTFETSSLLGEKNRQGNNYQSIEENGQFGGSALVFCVHGNKWGVATCCEDLENDTVTADSQLLLGDKFSKDDYLHCHTYTDEGVDKRARRRLLLASFLCLVFMVGEAVGGILSNSLAIATDAAHLLTDLGSFMLSLVAIHMAARPKSQRMSFGWHRAEVLGAIVSILAIWLVTGILVYIAGKRLYDGDYEVKTDVMLITSGFGVLVNIIMGATLHQHGHSHGEVMTHDSESNHSHGGGDKENINVKAAFIHVVGDFLQSIGVFIAALVIYFKPEFAFIDPICTFIFGGLVILTTINILWRTLVVLMEGTPPDISYKVVTSTFLAVDGIKLVHNLRVWSITTNKSALAAHLVIEKGFDSQKVLAEATKKIRSVYHIYYMTLQVEEFQSDMEECYQCQDPVK